MIQTGASHTKVEAVATPTVSGVFSRPEFGNIALRYVHSLGLGVPVPQGWQHGFNRVTTPSSTRWPSQSDGGFQSLEGAES